MSHLSAPNEEYNEQFRSWIRQRIEEGKKRSDSYSLRSFARYVGTSPATISQILSGKRPPSLTTVVKIADSCGMNADERSRFLRPFSNAPGTANWQTQHQYDQIDLDTFEVVSDWYHFAILSLGQVKNNSADPEWIAERLGITIAQAQGAFNRLRRLNLIVRRGTGFRQSGKPLTTTQDIPSTAIRKAHKQWLKMAASSLDNVAVDEREFGTVVMAVNPEKIGEAKIYLKKARRELCKILESGEQTKVYASVFGLFPVDGKDLT